ncbi:MULTISPECIES: trp operon leader peptide [Raoultella]|uniref:trp operon leader peptide n=1 Tax=Raoultella terrigena TaxID=577 RepID=A0AAP9XUX6_RAOTE|nr:trp operon leader peptide [Raoultella terrigena]MCI1033148.1 trp operon leader peptide [Raoultella terrigena]NWK85860.1 trp operon leader peptide [Raoultella terrigena]QIT31380.1 trp operon leader peptide [Raoultella terrigena]QPF11491.1 trp operon leader peptide [Raoultella terrigena]
MKTQTITLHGWWRTS